MGLINWFKDKVIITMERDIAMINARLEGFEMRIDDLQNKLISIRQRTYGVKQKQEEEQENTGEPTAKEWDEIKNAFGGIPIELIEKYNRGRKQ